MTGTPQRMDCLYAVVPSAESPAVLAGVRGVHAVACGPVAALAGRRGNRGEVRAALRHSQVVGRALERFCSSVVPLRFGANVHSGAELDGVLAFNLDQLSSHLARFRGRVEMGLKVRLPSLSAPALLPAALAAIRALAPEAANRRERLISLSGRQVFEGCYLVPRTSAGAFWAAVEDLRSSLTGFPILGSGPWAAYSFCDFALRQEPGGAHGVSAAERS